MIFNVSGFISARAIFIAFIVGVSSTAYSANENSALNKNTHVQRGAKSIGPFKPALFEGDIRDLPKAKPWKPGDPIKVIPRRTVHKDKYQPPGKPINPTTRDRDPLLEIQAAVSTTKTQRALTSPQLNFSGQSFSGAYPPDTNGDIGNNYYIQMVNGNGGALFSVYDKSDGSLESGPTVLDGFGTGNCAGGLGDPIVLYDVPQVRDLARCVLHLYQRECTGCLRFRS
jgi:hypothetical protein